jgi:hypothetical protein
MITGKGGGGKVEVVDGVNGVRLSEGKWMCVAVISVSISILLLTWFADDGLLLDFCFSLSIWGRKWRHEGGGICRFATFRSGAFGCLMILLTTTGWILEEFGEALLLERGEGGVCRLLSEHNM